MSAGAGGHRTRHRGGDGNAGDGIRVREGSRSEVRLRAHLKASLCPPLGVFRAATARVTVEDSGLSPHHTAICCSSHVTVPYTPPIEQLPPCDVAGLPPHLPRHSRAATCGD